MKKIFMTWVILNILCIIPSKIYPQNISDHNLTIDLTDPISNSTYTNQISFEVVYKPKTLTNNNLIPDFNNSLLLADYQYLKNKTVIAHDILTLPAQYFGLISTVLFHPLIHIFFVFNEHETENNSINTYSKTSLSKFNRKHPAVTCTPPDCAAQWNGNN